MWDAKPSSPCAASRLAALAWLDAYERHGGRVICDGRMFVVTPPSEDIDLAPCPDVAAVAWVAFHRDQRRRGISPLIPDTL